MPPERTRFRSRSSAGQIADAHRRHQQDLDRHRRLGLQRAGIGPRIAGGQTHQHVRQAKQGARLLRIVELAQTGAVGLGQAAAADIEAPHDRRYPIEVSLFDTEMVPGDRLQRAGEIVDRCGRLAAAALDQKPQPLLQGLDLDEVPERGDRIGIPAAQHQRRGKAADLPLAMRDGAWAHRPDVPFREEIAAREPLAPGRGLLLQRRAESSTMAGSTNGAGRAA